MTWIGQSMGIKYHVQQNAEYASYARSVRRGDRVTTEYIYLGKVVDRKNGLYFNRKLGYIMFDENDKRIVPAPNRLVPIDALEEESAILDFGDTHFIDAYMRKKGLMDCFESMGCTDTDTLCTLVMFYTLTHKTADHLKTWYEGNYTCEMYPRSKVELGDVLGFLD